MQNTCFKKCIERFNDSGTPSCRYSTPMCQPLGYSFFADLSVGENKCLDRCVSKVSSSSLFVYLLLTSDRSLRIVHGGAASSEHKAANVLTAAQWHEHVNDHGFVTFFIETNQSICTQSCAQLVPGFTPQCHAVIRDASSTAI